MVKKRRGSAKAALGQQRSELKRTAKGKQFIGEDTGSEHARAVERAKVLQMQAAARHASERVRDETSRWRVVGRLVRDTTRLAGTVAGLPWRMASAAVSVPVRLASVLLLRPREA